MAAFLTALPPYRLTAQCPDGSPPPCSRALLAAPPLDNRTWLILPFENTSHSIDAELIRQAGLNLLYQELSRWSDVRVISDNRVPDLLRLLPEVQRSPISLSSARTLARRVGAGRVVLGDYLAVGAQAQIAAKIYDVRSGQQLRLARERLSDFTGAAALDSMSATYSRLGAAILGLPPRQEAGSLAGTTSIEAYRAYVAGLAAYNRLASDSARTWMDRAIALDSNFALAHLRRWNLSTDTSARRQDLQAAVRLSASLPPRERALVDAYAAASRDDYEQLCRAAKQLVADDSSAADGWSLLSACYGDSRVVRESGAVHLRGNPSRSLHAAERAYALAPTSSDAFFSWLLNVAFQVVFFSSGSPDNPFRMVCADLGGTARCPPERLFRFSLLTVADSFIVVSQPWLTARRAPADRSPEAVDAWQRRAQRAREGLERFRQSAPDSWTLNWISSVLALETGDTTAAARAFGRGAIFPLDTSGLARTRQLSTGLSIALSRGHLADASSYLDSLRARQLAAVHLLTMFGRFGEAADTNARGRLYAAWRQVFAGVLPAGFDTLEARVAEDLTGPIRSDFLQLSTLVAFHLRGNGSALDTTAAHPVKRAQAWIANDNLPRARAALAEWDRELLARHVATSDDGGWLFSAELHLELGDSAVALDRLREFGRRWVFIAGQFDQSILEQYYSHRQTQRLWGRTWMLYGDLAMARGQAVDARRAYHMVVGFWEHGDPPVQPMVARARAALARIGN